MSPTTDQGSNIVIIIIIIIKSHSTDKLHKNSVNVGIVLIVSHRLIITGIDGRIWLIVRIRRTERSIIIITIEHRDVMLRKNN